MINKIAQIFNNRLSRMERLIGNLFLLVLFWMLAAPVFAMEPDLWSLPQPPKSEIIWKDKSIEINNIEVHARRLTCNLAPAEITGFYQSALQQMGWQLRDYFEEQAMMTFTKDGRFFYVVVFSGREGKNDVYLAVSGRELYVCKDLADYFLKEEIAPDAEGRDFADIPRCPSCRRRLNIFTQYEGAYLLYETDASLRGIDDFYRNNLKSQGWKLLPGLQPAFLAKFKQAKQALEKVVVLFFGRGEDTLVITAYPAPPQMSQARTLVAITRNLLDEIYPGGE